jgi:pimeloyl-ACP methyl ester carboxylesterase
MIKLHKIQLLKITLFVALAIYVTINLLDLTYRQPFQTINNIQKYGFEPVKCWFGETSTPPRTECYYMHVPEDHAQKTGKVIAFPVVVFRSNAIFSTKAPVLHLGAGGPGAPMYLDSIESIKTIWEYHNELSINQGRDLFVIDPRGTGLSKPLLTCDTFVENETKRLKDNLSITEQWDEVRKDYFECIAKFKSKGVNLSTYNSLSIANDIEMMRIAGNIDEWVLIGVSYAATYAQIIATQYPESVESMVLDSATFPNLKPHDNYLNKTMARYLALYNHCSLTSDCTTPPENIENRIWSLHQALNLNPIKLEIDHPYNNNKIDVLLNGERFISALLDGTYGEKIFYDLRHIIPQLERRRALTITPYLENHIAYLLDPTYGDVSATSHYCYEDKPYTNFDSIRIHADKLPKGYIRNTVLLSIDFPDYCNEMLIGAGDPVVSMATKTDIPTLFLHGELDTITPLSDVIEQRKLFTKNCLITHKLSHDVLSNNKYAERTAAKFISNAEIDLVKLDCSSIGWR